MKDLYTESRHLLETALPHRAYAGKSSTGLYALLEGYVRSIQAFGVKLLTRERMAEPAVKPVRPPKYQAPPPAPAATSASLAICIPSPTP